MLSASYMICTRIRPVRVNGSLCATYGTAAYCTSTVVRVFNTLSNATGIDPEREPAAGGAEGGLERHAAGAARTPFARLESDHRVRPERHAALPRHTPVRRRRCHRHQRLLIRRRFRQCCC